MIMNERIVGYFEALRNLGKLPDPDIVIEEGHPVCGDTVHLYIKLEGNKSIKEISFQTYGCATSVALSSMLCEKFEGSCLEDIGSISRENIADMLGKISPDQSHCIDIGVRLVERVVKEISGN